MEKSLKTWRDCWVSGAKVASLSACFASTAAQAETYMYRDPFDWDGNSAWSFEVTDSGAHYSVIGGMDGIAGQLDLCEGASPYFCLIWNEPKRSGAFFAVPRQALHDADRWRKLPRQGHS
jgi:hypothetical protein